MEVHIRVAADRSRRDIWWEPWCSFTFDHFLLNEMRRKKYRQENCSPEPGIQRCATKPAKLCWACAPERTHSLGEVLTGKILRGIQMEHDCRRFSHPRRCYCDRMPLLLREKSPRRPKRTLRSGLVEPRWKYQVNQRTLAENAGERAVTRKRKERFSQLNTEWSLPLS